MTSSHSVWPSVAPANEASAPSPARRPVVFLFSGQGSQYHQMARGLFESQPVFREWMQRADAWVRQSHGRALIEEIYHPQREKSDPFTRVLTTHPAIFAVEYAAVQMLKAEGIRADYLLGASLGEIVAAAVAEVISFERALEIVCRQAELLETTCPNSGGMLAVLGPISLYHTEPLLATGTTLAGVNYESHFIVSGANPELEAAERRLRELGVICQRLPVTHGFHSKQIEPIADAYRRLLDQQVYRVPATPLVFCSRAGLVETIEPQMMWTSVRGPIRFHDTLQWLEARGGGIYIDVGPSGTLATLAKYNLARNSRSVTLPLLTPFGRDLETLAKVRTAARQALV